MASREAAEAAARDLRDKLAAERAFRSEVRAASRGTARAFASALLASGESGAADAAARAHREAIEPALLAHYRRVAEVFGRRTRSALAGEDVEATAREDEEIDGRLEAAWAERAPRQAGYVEETTRERAERSIRLADIERARRAEDGERVDRAEFAALAAGFLGRYLAGRESLIAAVETQAAAELSKAIEAEGLLGVSEVDAKALRPSATKEWVSQGDNLVRPWHLDADGQTRSIRLPFDVGGERLMYPGDESLGATKKNTSNCRCSAHYAPGPIRALRLALLGALAGVLFGEESEES